MFNLTPREKALRTIVLDECVNSSNLKMFAAEDGKNFQQAIAIESNLKIATVKRKIRSEEGFSLAKYPKVRVLVERALGFYSEAK